MQSPIGVLRKMCSENTQHIYRENTQHIYRTTPIFGNFIATTLRHGCSPVTLLHIFRTPFPKITFGELMLILAPVDLHKNDDKYVRKISGYFSPLF